MSHTSERAPRNLASTLTWTVLVAMVLTLLQLTAPPTAAAQPMIDGDVSLAAAPAGAGLVEVRYTVANTGDDAAVTFNSITLPAEAAASAQCRAERGNNTQTTTVGSDGTIAVSGSSANMPAASEFLVACRFDATDLCGLDGAITATWTNPAGDDLVRSTSGPVTPPCPEPEMPEEAQSSGGPVMVLYKTPSHESAPFGSTVTWTVTAQNAGTRRLTQVEVIDVLHAGLEFVPGSAGSGVSYDPDTRTVTIRIGRVPVGQSKSATFETRVGALSLIPNAATGVSAQGATAFAESGVFGLAAPLQATTDAPTTDPARIVPAAATDQDQRRAANNERRQGQDRNRPRDAQLAFTGAETTVLAILGASLVVAGGLTVTTARRIRHSDQA